jgi:hypothetical protein
VNDTGEPDVVASEVPRHAVEDLPEEALCRYCETDRLSEIAWCPAWGRSETLIKSTFANVLGDPSQEIEPMFRERHDDSFYLIVFDRDNGTFSIEGPMTDDRQWNHAVVVAQKSGRQVTCSTANGPSAEDAARDWLQRYSGTQVPPGKIVHL